MNSGIYKISFTGSNDFYIGSTQNFKIRKNDHINTLKRNVHRNNILQVAFVKYGISNFKFTIIAKCEISKLIKLEQLYLDGLNPTYNISKIAGRNINYKLTLKEMKEMAADYLSNKYSKPEILFKYNVSHVTMHNILDKYDLKLNQFEIEEIKSKKSVHTVTRNDAKLNRDVVSNIKYYIDKGYIHSSIAKYYNIYSSTISKIKSNEIYKNVNPKFTKDISNNLIKFSDIDPNNKMFRLQKTWIKKEITY